MLSKLGIKTKSVHKEYVFKKYLNNSNPIQFPLLQSVIEPVDFQ